MIPAWLTSFLKWLVSLFVHEAVEQVKEEVQKPTTIENANTPKKLKAAVDADIASKLERMRNTQSSDRP